MRFKLTKCTENRLSAWCSSRNHLFIFNRTSNLFVVLITFLSRLKKENVPIAGACAHLQDSIHFLHFCRIIRHEVFMFIRLNLHLSQLNSTSISRSENISFFLHQKDMFASSSWCKHFLFGLRRREKKISNGF